MHALTAKPRPGGRQGRRQLDLAPYERHTVRQEFSYKYIPGSMERTRSDWDEFISHCETPPCSTEFVPALGGCFLVLQTPQPIAHLVPRPSLWRHKSAGALLRDYEQWRSKRSPAAHHGTVMVIDDDQSILKLLQLSLGSSGYTVTGYADGRLALDALDESRLPDIMVVDLKMPGMDGRQFLQELRRRGLETRVVIASAFEASAAQEELEADAAIAKPFEMEDLVTLVHGLTGNTQPAPAA